MKTYRHMLLLLGYAIAATSCFNSEYDYDRLFPAEYAKILSIKNAGTVTQTMSTLEEVSTYDMIVLKGGWQSQTTSQATVCTWTQDELDKYARQNGLKCSMIPEGTWSVCTPEIRFAAGTQAQHVPVEFRPSLLRDEMEANPDVSYLLPLRVVSEDSVMEGKDEIIIEVRLEIPTVSLTGLPTEVTRITEEVQQINLQGQLSMYESNTDRCTCPLVYAGDEYVAQYNASQSTDIYLPLPQDAYGLGVMNFTPGTENADATVSIRKERLEPNKYYVLPVKAGPPSNPGIAPDGQVYYLPLFNPSHEYETADCDRTDWEILFYNSEAAGMASPSILDGDPGTFWHSAWEGSYWSEYEDCFDYSHTMGQAYDLCLGRRNLPITIVIDMKERVWIHSLGIVQRSGLSNMYAKGVEFYVSDDEQFLFSPVREGGDISDYSDVAQNRWTQILTDSNIPQQEGVIWRQVPDGTLAEGISGHLLKIRFTATWHTSQDCMSMAELYVKAVNKVDGKPINLTD